ncbi:hypothetical protein BDV96DRAFT_675292 [Lophiotrema nucula]|uniref:FAD-binding domain-containing protein n=1 Tax=Lophiotrema nucula TaxID=690887 RepID=A0A6A5YH89_9PLEO|nr:hypothetical protein BDV96DRAFT_675292 [Lophiotrema nucula]
MSQRVLIVGAGISGLALAHGLKKAGISIAIFERDEDLDSLSRPLAMRVTEDSKTALKDILSPEDYQELIRRSAEIGRASLSEDGGATTMPAIDRGTLRKLLLTGLENDIWFGKEMEHYTNTEAGVTVHFRDGHSESGSLLVGADGVHSKVREQYLPDLQLLDTEGRLLWGKSKMTVEARGALRRDVGAGIPDHVAGGTTTIIVIPIIFDQKNAHVPDDYVYWVICTNKSNIGMTDKEFLSLSHDQAATLARKLVDGVDCVTPSQRFRLSVVKDLIPELTTKHILYTASPDWYVSAWHSSPNVTLIGDAIHPLGMGAGGGAAMKDAHELLKLLLRAKPTKETIEGYERGMIERAKPLLRMSTGRGQVLFGQPPFPVVDPIPGQP